MQINSYTPVYIFALNFEKTHVCRCEEQAASLEQEALDDLLGKGNYGLCTGSWEGVQERSYIVTAERWRRHSEVLEALLENSKQEAVLFLDNQRNAALYFKADNYQHGNDTQHLGVFKEVSPTLVADLKGWPRIGNTYFAARA